MTSTRLIARTLFQLETGCAADSIRHMPFYFRKRATLNKTTHVNLSKAGASVSERVGPVTMNSRGRVSVRILPGLSFRFGKRR